MKKSLTLHTKKSVPTLNPKSSTRNPKVLVRPSVILGVDHQRPVIGKYTLRVCFPIETLVLTRLCGPRAVLVEAVGEYFPITSCRAILEFKTFKIPNPLNTKLASLNPKDRTPSSGTRRLVRCIQAYTPDPTPSTLNPEPDAQIPRTKTGKSQTRVVRCVEAHTLLTKTPPQPPHNP